MFDNILNGIITNKKNLWENLMNGSSLLCVNKTIKYYSLIIVEKRMILS